MDLRKHAYQVLGNPTKRNILKTNKQDTYPILRKNKNLIDLIRIKCSIILEKFDIETIIRVLKECFLNLKMDIS